MAVTWLYLPLTLSRLDLRNLGMWAWAIHLRFSQKLVGVLGWEETLPRARRCNKLHSTVCIVLSVSRNARLQHDHLDLLPFALCPLLFSCLQSGCDDLRDATNCFQMTLRKRSSLWNFLLEHLDRFLYSFLLMNPLTGSSSLKKNPPGQV